MKMRTPAAMIFSLWLAVHGRAHESPIDHVERELEFSVKDGQLLLDYRLRFSDRALLMQVGEMDTNGDGRLSEQETAAYFTAQAAKLAELLKLQIDGHPLALKPTGAARPDIKLTQAYQFCAPLTGLRAGRHAGLFVDGHSRMYPGGYRWRQNADADVKQTRVVPLTEPDPKTTQHPEWLELKFEIIVPE
ncbi:MAG TPA: hypothetical protein VGO11_01350 [Chthoniobacteraceae bacterium]|jgi:hypothetical protein|nr:hypothetical protein [Chthoniobacteraceae bacterium]